jgi:hypothetical protein
MQNFKHCPDCSAVINGCSCKCGWKFDKNSNPGFKTCACSFVEYVKVCSNEVDVRRVGGSNENPIYWCYMHYEKYRVKTDMDHLMQERARLFEECARQAGMSLTEFSKDYLKNWLQGHGVSLLSSPLKTITQSFTLALKKLAA